MKKILLAALVAVFSCAAFGQGATVVGTNMPPYPTCTGSNVPCALAVTGKTANVSGTLLLTAPATGTYRVGAYGVETVRDTVSSTLPNIQTAFTDADSSVVETISATGNSATNTVGTIVQGQAVFHAKTATVINYQTANYASGSAGVMTYSFYLVIERLQ